MKVVRVRVRTLKQKLHVNAAQERSNADQLYRKPNLNSFHNNLHASAVHARAIPDPL